MRLTGAAFACRPACPSEVARTATPSTAAAADHEHDHHSHPSKYTALVDAAADCVVRGETCLDHCLASMASGDTTLAHCARSVNELLAVCGALRSLGAQDANSLPAMARIAHDVCLRCEEECRKHAKPHAECRGCTEACVACAKECKGIAA